jgi:hypothetical protein
MNDPIVLVEIGYFNPGVGPGVLRFCDGVAYRTRPTETPANALYRPFLSDPGWYRFDIFSAPGQYGHVTPGEVKLNDQSGQLAKQLLGLVFGGYSIVIRIGERGAPYPGGYVTVLNGTTATEPAFDSNEITFRPGDLSAAQEKPLQQVKYAGTNVLPNGLEGVDDLTGTVKTLVLALASNMTPILVNTAKVIYQISAPIGTKAITVTQGRDKGVVVTAAATAYATLADMISTAPAAGTYRVYSSVTEGCFVRLGMQPTGTFTVDAAYGNAADRTHAQVWQRLLMFAGVPAVAISADDVSALDLALPAEIEYAIFDETNANSALTEVANSAGAAWFGDQNGVYRLQQWQVPAGVPVATLTELRTDTMAITDTVGGGAVAPAYRITLSFGKNWTTMSDSSLGGDKASATDPVRAPAGRTGLSARAWLAKEYRTVESVDNTVKAVYPNAVDLKLTSLISNPAAAQSYCDQQMALYKVARHVVSLSQWLSPAQIDVVRAGAVVRVFNSDYGYETGRLMRIAGGMVDRMTKKTDLTCWG